MDWIDVADRVLADQAAVDAVDRDIKGLVGFSQAVKLQAAVCHPVDVGRGIELDRQRLTVIDIPRIRRILDTVIDACPVCGLVGYGTVIRAEDDTLPGAPVRKDLGNRGTGR